MQETETPTPTLGQVPEDERRPGREHVLRVYSNSWQSTEVKLSTEDLEAIVQAAYDQHGITAQPFLAEPPTCNGTAHCPAEAMHLIGCAGNTNR